MMQWQRFFTVEKMERIKTLILSNKIITDTGCWVWRGPSGGERDGYGQLIDGGDKWPIHRLVAMIYLNFKPDSLKYICHKCDNRKCINPDHFFIGDIYSNMQDKIDKRRHIKGEQVLSHKLTLNQVKEIKKLADEGLMSEKEIGERYNVSQSCVNRIKNGRRWNCSLTGDLNIPPDNQADARP